MAPKKKRVRVQGVVMLLCSKPGCPRTRTVAKDETMPEGTATIASLCPWHDDWRSDRQTESYYDANGKQLQAT